MLNAAFPEAFDMSLKRTWEEAGGGVECQWSVSKGLGAPPIPQNSDHPPRGLRSG
jgi:hypothetical protein